MGKFNFSKTIEHTFKNYTEFVNDIIDEYNTGKDIEIAVTWEQVPEILRGIVSKANVLLYDIDFAYPEINGYNKEYLISLCHGLVDGKDDALFVERAFNDDLEKYLSIEDCDNTTAFVSQDVNIGLYGRFVDEKFNIVLFDVGE